MEVTKEISKLARDYATEAADFDATRASVIEQKTTRRQTSAVKAAGIRAESNATDRKAAQHDIQNGPTWNDSHRHGGGDEDPGRTPSNADTESVNRAAQDIVKNLSNTSAPFVEPLKSIKAAQDAEFTRVWRELSNHKSWIRAEGAR